MPQISILNMVGNPSIERIEALHIDKSGEIQLLKRVDLLLMCFMDLTFYPFDSQECPVSFYSDESKLDVVAVSSSLIHESPAGFRIATISNRKTSNLTSAPCHTRRFMQEVDCSELFMLLERRYSINIIFQFLPSFLCVIVSFFAFWIKVDHVPARVTLGVTTFLAILGQSQSINSSMPKVSYLKALDVWLIVCNIFVFGTMIENTVAQVLLRKKQRQSSGIIENLRPSLLMAANALAAIPTGNMDCDKNGSESSRSSEKQGKHVENYTLIYDGEKQFARFRNEKEKTDISLILLSILCKSLTAVILIITSNEFGNQIVYALLAILGFIYVSVRLFLSLFSKKTKGRACYLPL
ncbi:Oidioi.mRNA.OKI2018_I69.XSR.g15222.t1.cds [Oikopleura dioica]|uniref:Oidioi.mRNA.OKI2018_I69.XSR.g15222.t1.cds n=1 Tax=Oikopleura dioica TaxID=34765 RepID=A0ABN7SCM2_OIKDI|nr:Oidioi.mRNA.OKI2018_I69.XSR.g15222.t1.cds [Oikopleura dioica]